MGIKFSEEELQKMLEKNPNLRISSTFGKDAQKIKIEKNKTNLPKIKINPDSKLPTTKKRKSLDVKKINDTNLEAKYIYSYSENHFSFVIFGARLLTVNDIFALLQSRPYEIFIYKKKWYSIIQKILQEAKADSIKNNQIFPYFNGKVELTLLRQAPKLVDSDSISTMYKFLIDSIKLKPMKKLTENQKSLHVGLISEDDPSIVSKINHYNNLGEFSIGLKIEKLKSPLETLKLEDILK